MSRLENIQNSFKSIQAKTKAFFHGDRWKEALVFFFFILLAFGFWLLQSLQQEYEIELVFPVKYKNVPVDIAFNTPEVKTITAKVKDKGSVLLNYTFGRSFAPIEVNMKNTKEKNCLLYTSFTSPIVMMVRVPFEVPLWEILLSIGFLYISSIGFTWFSAKIYRVGILMYGKKPSIKEMSKWLRYK